MRKAKTFIVTVQGNRNFPIDMLRYDRATPTSEEDSGKIHHSEYAERAIQDISVTMSQKPTDQRWASFQWKVINVEERR